MKQFTKKDAKLMKANDRLAWAANWWMKRGLTKDWDKLERAWKMYVEAYVAVTGKKP